MQKKRELHRQNQNKQSSGEAQPVVKDSVIIPQQLTSGQKYQDHSGQEYTVMLIPSKQTETTGFDKIYRSVKDCSYRTRKGHVYMLLKLYEELTSAEIKILNMLIFYKDAMNVFYGTQAEISEFLGLSKVTTNKALRKLESLQAIYMIKNGQYLVNPKLIMNGYDNKYKAISDYYQEQTGKTL